MQDTGRGHGEGPGHLTGPYDSLIDLHVHSTASDGSLTPLEILELACEKGVKAISITDHDSIDGIREIHDHIHKFSLEVISGVEISCEPPEEFQTAGSIHLLGYGFSIYDKTLNQTLDQAKISRKQRNPRIIQALNRLGIEISLQEVQERFKAEQTGRPHIAQMLMEKGAVSSFKQAFDQYLGKGKPAYVGKFKISCKKAIQIILNAGGIPVLAHPGLIDPGPERDLASFVQTLAGFGLQGMEVYYTDHDLKVTADLKSLAKRNKLLITGGSDFHGSFNTGVSLGRGRENIRVDYSLFKGLTDRLAAIRNLHARLDILESNLEYRFIDRDLLGNALCHRSYLNENQKTCSSDNERLEFLGDAVLGLCIGHILMKKNPLKKEGELSKLRSSLVSEPALADMARKIDLGRFIRLGKGEAVSGGADKNSILSDAFEAVIAAVYLDAGFDRTFDLVHGLFRDTVDRALSCFDIADYKSTLQEYAQEIWSTTPVYTVAGEIGPDHDKTFEVRLELAGFEATGLGKTKKAAEQASAQNALKQIRQSREKQDSNRVFKA